MPAGRATNIRRLTDSSGGTPSTTDTIVDQPAAYNEATLAAIVATLTRKVNELIIAVGRKAR